MIILTEKEKADRFDALQTALKCTKESYERRRADADKRYRDATPIGAYNKGLPDGFGNIPQCPVCGEMPYSTEQCYWCGQRFIQDAETEEYNKPDKGTMDCFQCGGKGTVEFMRSKYNGHKHGECKKCGMRFMERGEDNDNFRRGFRLTRCQPRERGDGRDHGPQRAGAVQSNGVFGRVERHRGQNSKQYAGGR